MKIALANNLYYPYNRGGAETVIRKMITDLKSQGHDIFLITTKPRGESQPKDSQKETEKTNLRTYYLDSSYYNLAAWPNTLKIFWHFTNIFSFKKTRAIKKILNIEKPNLIITHNLMGLGFLLPRTIKKLNIRHEHYLHDIQLLYPSGLMIIGQEKIIDGLSAKIYQFFTRAFFASPSKVVSPSNWLLNQHRQRGFFKDSEIEIKNLITKTQAPLITRVGPAKNFLFVGQIEEHKGILFLLKTFLGALEIKPELKLTVVGDGALINEAKEIATNSSQIEFRGHLDNLAINTLMKENDYLIIPSLCYENAPMTIYEAKAAGLAVIASNLGGIPEIVSSNDKLFKAGSMADLKKIIIDIN